MKVTKYGHCCLLLETKGTRILTDPGAFSDIPKLGNIDIVLITHEHGDHLHTDSLQTILSDNPEAVVITNSSVGAILTDLRTPYIVVEDGDNQIEKGVVVRGYGTDHAVIVDDFGQVMNTGYFVDDYLFYPGDAFTDPNRDIPALALPTAGPWAKISDVIDYVRSVKPAKAFPVHDAVLSDIGRDLHNRLVTNLKPSETEYIVPQMGQEFEI